MTEKVKSFTESIKTGLGKAWDFLKIHRGKIDVAILVVVLIAAVGYGQYSGWLERQPKFHDVTIELGDPLPDMEAFLTEYANIDKVRLVTEQVDLTAVGEQPLVFAHNKKEETVTLTIQDTTAPKVEFHNVAVTIQEVVEPEDLVSVVEELSAYTISFQLPDAAATYGDVTVQVLVTDEYGNETAGESTISYRWMRELFELELGRTLRRGMLVYGPVQNEMVLDQEQIDAVNASAVGEYTVSGTYGDSVNECVIVVKDTTAPTLQLQDVAIYIGQTAELEDFVVSAADISGEVQTRLTEPLKLDEAGVYTVVVEAEDINGNIATAEAELRVIVDTDPPEFFGMYTLNVEKHSTPGYYFGISAVDARDGEVEFSVDDSRVDTSKAGTYYAVYTAVDNEGNVGTYRRKVVVLHDAEDTAAWIRSIAAGLSSDPEEIRNYVRDNIWYSYEWGGDDPIWFGLNEGNGNCYVHAMVFQALLREKGYETQLIWVTDRTHYWNMVKINGVWRHMDSTPGRLHERYSIMTDATRYETLSGRDWDRTAWPVAE